MHEHLRGPGAGYQIYAAPALVSDTRAVGVPFASSLLFAGQTQPPTPSGELATTTSAVGLARGDDSDASRRRASIYASPAPLNRPISIFSDV
jgi:hypothetical protein